MARPCLDRNVKFKQLVRLLGLPRPYVRGLLEVMWDVANECGNPVLGTAAHVEAAAEWPGEPGILFQALRAGRWIEPCDARYAGDAALRNAVTDDTEWQIHDYFHHAPDYAKVRADREKERQKDKNCAFCNAAFKSTEMHAKYCGNPCRQAAYRQKNEDGVTDCNAGVTDGRVTVTESYAPPAPAPAPAPALNNTPPPPTGGVEATGNRKKKRSADHEKEAIARAIVQHYQDTVKPDHTTARGTKNVLSLLGRGLTHDRLKNATSGYAARCAQRGTEPKYRTAVGNFFGQAEVYLEFLDYQPEKARDQMTPEERAEFDRKKSEEWKNKPYAPG